MTPDEIKTRKFLIYALIGLGFAGLIAAHELTSPDDNASITVPFILALVGTASFIGAGLLARKLLREMWPR